MIRRGFTLIEVMISIVVTGLVATLAYAATQAGFDTEARIESHQAGAARTAVVRALLLDVFRHAVPGVRGGDDVFVLFDRRLATGQPADSIRVTTRGVVSPLGASDAWTVSAWLSGDTLYVQGHPLMAGAESPPPVSARLDGVTGFDVRALGRGLATSWVAEWPEHDVAPDAITLSVSRAGEALSHQVVRRDLERAP